MLGILVRRMFYCRESICIIRDYGWKPQWRETVGTCNEWGTPNEDVIIYRRQLESLHIWGSQIHCNLQDTLMNKQLYVQVIQTMWLLFEWLSRVGHEEQSGRKETWFILSNVIFHGRELFFNARGMWDTWLMATRMNRRLLLQTLNDIG